MRSAIQIARLVLVLGSVRLHAAARTSAQSLRAQGSGNSSEISVLPDTHDLAKLGSIQSHAAQQRPAQIPDVMISSESHPLLHDLKKTFAYAESVMSHPAVIGGHSSSIGFSKQSHTNSTTTKWGTHPMDSVLDQPHQTFLSQLASRRRRMGMMETVVVALGVLGGLIALTMATSCMVKVSTTRAPEN